MSAVESTIPKKQMTAKSAVFLGIVVVIALGVGWFLWYQRGLIVDLYRQQDFGRFIRLGSSISFKKVRLSVTDQTPTRGNFVIRSKEDFVKTFPNVAVPDIDFQQNMLLVMAAGQRSHGGYTLTINDIRLRHGTVTVYATSTSTKDYCVNTQSFIYLYSAVSIPTTTHTVQFREQKIVLDCR